MNDKKQGPQIELSSLYFYEGSTPSSLQLRDCNLPFSKPIPEAFSALYGYAAKQDAFMYAREYSETHRINFTVIDFRVRLSRPQNPLMMKPGDLASHDFVIYQRLSKALTDDLREALAETLQEKGLDPTAMDLTKPQKVIADRPELLGPILQRPEWRHMKVVAHPARTVINSAYLTVATIPHQYWGLIEDATCRLNPQIQIKLDPPSGVKARSQLGVEQNAPKPTASRSKRPKQD